jgi:uncharacterized protein YndB with AHSA1/START domain
MAANDNTPVESTGYELVITRVFDAPRSLVWQAWTDPVQVAHWLGPHGFTGRVERLDGRVGGAYRFHLRAPDGRDHWMQGIHREIVPPEKLVNTYVWADAQGRPTGPETLLTITLIENQGKTTLTLRQRLFDSVTARDAHREGWTSALDCLAEVIGDLRAEQTA